MILQSKTQRLIIVVGGIIAFNMFLAIGFCLYRGMTYDFERGLIVIPRRNGTSGGVGVCYRDGQPTLCYAYWRGDGTVSSAGFGRFSDWRSMWKNFDPDAAPYGEGTEFYENGTRKAFGIRQVKDGIEFVECWGWHSDGAIATRFASRDSEIEGTIRAWYPSGQIKFELPMKAGKREGRFRWFTQSGDLIAQCVCKDDERHEGDYIIWYGDTGFDGDLFFGPTDGRDYVVETRTSYRDGQMIKKQLWNQQGELVGTGQCRDGEKWDGVFSSNSSDNDSTTITDLSIWADGVELAVVPFDSEASSEEIQKLIAEVRASAVPQSPTESGTD